MPLIALLWLLLAPKLIENISLLLFLSFWGRDLKSHEKSSEYDEIHVVIFFIR